jgi:hypothetical protein
MDGLTFSVHEIAKALAGSHLTPNLNLNLNLSLTPNPNLFQCSTSVLRGKEGSYHTLPYLTVSRPTYVYIHHTITSARLHHLIHRPTPKLQKTNKSLPTGKEFLSYPQSTIQNPKVRAQGLPANVIPHPDIFRHRLGISSLRY